jgi:hypothetical protein
MALQLMPYLRTSHIQWIPPTESLKWQSDISL